MASDEVRRLERPRVDRAPIERRELPSPGGPVHL